MLHSRAALRSDDLEHARGDGGRHVECADELDPAWFVGARAIGITAGASTPASQIAAARSTITRMVGEE